MKVTSLIEQNTENIAFADKERTGKLRVLVYTTLFPNSVHPLHGNFILERMRYLRPFAEMSVIAPIPYFPRVKLNARWFKLASVPRCEDFGGFEVDHPRYLVIPKLGMTTHGVSMFAGSLRQAVKRLRATHFDLIDAHYVYPDGVAATMLGAYFKKPVVISARGTDINVFPKLPLIRPMVRCVLQRADAVISVSRALKDLMVGLGCASEKITVIGNGVDPQKFNAKPRVPAREALGLPIDSPILISVGQLLEAKGFHVLVDAVARLRQSGQRVLLVVIGEGPFRTSLEKQISDLGLQDQVRLVGSKPHDELATWYSAADFFCFASSREGWPNVILEAMSCGLPVLASPAGSIPDILSAPFLGELVERSSEAFTHTIRQAIGREWDREAIIARAHAHKWNNVAAEVFKVYTRVLDARNAEASS